MSTRRIVVGYEGSPVSGQALDWAAVEAQRRGADLHIAYADLHAAQALPLYPMAFDVSALEVGREIIDEGIRRATDALPRERVTGEAVISSPAAYLVEKSRDAELVVTGSRGRGTVAAGLLGSVAYAVAAHAECPVAIVRGEKPRPLGPDLPIVAGVDGSPASQRAAAEAARLAAELGARLRLVTVVALTPGEVWEAYAVTGRAVDPEQEQRQATERIFEELSTEFRREHPGLAVETLVLEGRAGDELAGAGRGAGLVVIGSHGHGGFTGMLLGSVSHRVVHEATCPVLVVRR
jgi:nucleotide-binding universal stress UspA family protein